MSEIISNCCSASPTDQDCIDGDYCPKCKEHCEWIDPDTDDGDYKYEERKDRFSLTSNHRFKQVCIRQTRAVGTNWS